MCVLKHLAQAEVLMTEAELGYPEHRWLAFGHLAEAETEMLDFNPEISEEIRHNRKLYIEENTPFPTMKLIRKVNGLYEQNPEMPSNSV